MKKNVKERVTAVTTPLIMTTYMCGGIIFFGNLFESYVGIVVGWVIGTSLGIGVALVVELLIDVFGEKE